ncbi:MULTISPECIES: hypothetical protein [Streptococcus]|jgi:hypothetical protein|uniref:Uncharacterized protein n=1 Tax=Streptococcus mitis TaxID=28037 RepID=A0A7X1RPY8_STRMT|nr:MULTISPECIES: hypothetical protein [Streptococcus]MQQ53151.1 hypothetical protein [Streptococcus mitis]WNS73465.1 hypothetical protein RRU92_10295 [Streptococcus sp. DTU_2020_1001019_1_SI_AUS_MUR_006]
MKLDMETKNEEWVEVFKGLISVDNYRLKVLLTNLSDGQEIRLIGEQNRFKLSCIYYDEARVFSRELYLSAILDKEMFTKFEKNNFQNVIYEVKNSQLVRKLEYTSYYDLGTLHSRHYIIITQDSVVEILVSANLKLDISQY